MSLSIEEMVKRYRMISSEANTIRENDKALVKGLFSNFYGIILDVGIGFQRAYGSILSGDYFDLIHLPDGNYLFVFADISGHGLPAYTTLVRLRSAIVISIKSIRQIYEQSGAIDTTFLVKNIATVFTDLMDEANSTDFACVNFTFIQSEEDRFHLRFYNRSMLFPIVLRRKNTSQVEVVNLNNRDDLWEPRKGYLLGSEIRKLLAETYLEAPYCDFTLYEGESILFYSDGIIEAHENEKPKREFGDQGVEDVLRSCYDLSPQLIVHELFNAVYTFIGDPALQKDDMTAVLIDFPSVR